MKRPFKGAIKRRLGVSIDVEIDSEATAIRVAKRLKRYTTAPPRKIADAVVAAFRRTNQVSAQQAHRLRVRIIHALGGELDGPEPAIVKADSDDAELPEKYRGD